MTSSSVNGNVAGSSGGGIYDVKNLTLTNSHIDNNTSYDGGGGAYETGAGHAITLTNSTVNGNRVAGSYDGGGISGSGSTVTLTKSQVNNNYAGGNGGGIADAIVFVLGGSQVNGNTAGSNGGGISSWNHEVTVTASQLLNNVSDGGGATFAFNGNVTIQQASQVSGNTATWEGGGIWMIGGNLTITNSTVANNTATRNGGGIYVGAGTSNTIVVTGSTFSGNRAAGHGGGLYLLTTGPADTNPISFPNGSILANDTISGNFAQGGGIVFGGTGGLAIIDDTIAATIAANIAFALGGGLAVLGGTATVGNTIIASNRSIAGPDVYNSTTVTDLGGNLIGINDVSSFVAGLPNVSGSYVGASGAPLNPKLGPLANNGGPTQTRALLSGSQALHHGLPALNSSFGITTDQRGVPRSTTQPDIGAFDPPRALRASSLQSAHRVGFPELLCRWLTRYGITWRT